MFNHIAALMSNLESTRRGGATKDTTSTCAAHVTHPTCPSPSSPQQKAHCSAGWDRWSSFRQGQWCSWQSTGTDCPAKCTGDLVTNHKPLQAHRDSLTRGVSGIRISPSSTQTKGIIPSGQGWFLACQPWRWAGRSSDAFRWQRDLPQLMSQRGVSD